MFRSEADVFKLIWETRPHNSFVTGLPIYEATAANFAHVAAKGKYPALRLNPRNIVLLTFREHQLFDQGTQDQRENYIVEIMGGLITKEAAHGMWQPLYDLLAEMKSLDQVLRDKGIRENIDWSLYPACMCPFY